MNALSRLSAYLYAHFDKVLHVLAGVLLALAGLAAGYVGGPKWMLFLAMAAPIVGGAAREAWNEWQKRGSADPMDFLATALGGFPVWIAFAVGSRL